MKKRRRDGPDDYLKVTLDPHRLDLEWLNHPDRMQKVGELLADANDRVDRMKSALEVKKAQVELRIRKKPQLFGLDKVTDKSVEATMTANEEVTEATDRYNRAKHKAGLLKALYEARKDCRPALENLVKLFLSSYFGDPKAPKDATREQSLRFVAKELFEPLDDQPRKKKRRVRDE
jgi:hypothetical protein